MKTLAVDSNTNYVEVTQTYPILFCLVTDEHKPMHSLAKCREFINDYVYYQYLDKKGDERYTVYGFTVQKKNDCGIDKMEIFFNYNAAQKGQVKGNKDSLVRFHELVNCDEVGNPVEYENGFVFKIPSQFKKTQYLCNFYTMLLKTQGIFDFSGLTVCTSLDEYINKYVSIVQTQTSNESNILKMDQSILVNVLSRLNDVEYLDDPCGLTVKDMHYTHAEGIKNVVDKIKRNQVNSNNYVSLYATG